MFRKKNEPIIYREGLAQRNGDPIQDIQSEWEDRMDAALNDSVNHPAHYTSGSIEVIDFIEDQKFPYHLGNACKYICRAGKKDPEKTVEDLRKAVWYINRYIELLEKSDGGRYA